MISLLIARRLLRSFSSAAEFTFQCIPISRLALAIQYLLIRTGSSNDSE